MRLRLAACLIVPLCLGAVTQAMAAASATDVVNGAIDGFIRPGYQTFHRATSALLADQQALCAAPS